jgi:tRNA(adenine34) deaminase
MMNHEFFMRKAIEEAQIAAEDDETPVGAVVVHKERIIAKSHNLIESLNDVTAHAEMLAITAAENFLGSKYLNECTMYITLEPCTMCGGAIAWAQLGTLIYGASDPQRGSLRLNPSVIHPKTVVIGGVLSEECGKIIKDFFRKKR